jgi:Cu(I)/Ag(I) efflux system protein CusF
MRKLIVAILSSCAWLSLSHGQNTDMTLGQITKIDKTAKKVTIRHNEIKHLNMPPMRMVFQVRDPALLEKISPNQKVKFSAIEEKGVYIVTAIEPDSP